MTQSTLNEKRMNIFSLTWPIFIEIFLYMLLGNVDTLMLSQYSDNSVAAVGVSNQLMGMIVITFGIVSSGTGIMIAQYLGAGRRKSAAEVAAVSLAANLVFGLILSLVLIIFGRSFLRAMNIPAELLQDAFDYTRVVGGFVFIQALMMTTTTIIRNHGYMKVSMFTTIGMNLINVLGNYAFIFGPFGIPKLGVTGVALSTTISRLVGFTVLSVVLYRVMKGELSFKLLRPFPKATLRSLLRIGIPSAGEQISYNTSQVLITYFISMLGAQAITTKVYTQNLMMFIYLLAIALGQGTSILVGHLVGAGKFEEAYKACMKSLKIAMTVSFTLALAFFLLRKNLLGIFTDNTSIIALGSSLLMITVLLEPGRTFNLVIINSLRASGDVKFPVYMGIISMWGVSATLSYILGIHFGLGLVGMWIAFAMDEWIRGIMMLLRWRSRVWERMAFVKVRD